MLYKVFDIILFIKFFQVIINNIDKVVHYGYLYKFSKNKLLTNTYTYNTKFCVINSKGIHLYSSQENFLRFMKPLISYPLLAIADVNKLDISFMKEDLIVNTPKNLNGKLYNFYIKISDLHNRSSTYSFRSKKEECNCKTSCFCKFKGKSYSYDSVSELNLVLDCIFI